MARDSANWRDLAWLLLNSTIGTTLCFLTVALFFTGGTLALQPLIWPWAPAGIVVLEVHSWATAFLAVPFGVVSLLLWWWLSPLLIRADAAVARRLLGPTKHSRLAGRVHQLAASRAETVDTQAAELRRIERDLHDGAQARLVGLGMSLGLAEELLDDNNPEAAKKLLTEARTATGAALSDLRELVRGIHPPVLADRGLDGAIQALVLTVPVPVTVTTDLPVRLPAPVESAAYFAVAEALTNVVKHSGADDVWVQLAYTDRRLSIEVGDNGRGGADSTRGTGLRGIERRLSPFDGSVSVSSPPGGPTVVRMEVPCEPSSPKISPFSETA